MRCTTALLVAAGIAASASTALADYTFGLPNQMSLTNSWRNTSLTSGSGLPVGTYYGINIVYDFDSVAGFGGAWSSEGRSWFSTLGANAGTTTTPTFPVGNVNYSTGVTSNTGGASNSSPVAGLQFNFDFQSAFNYTGVESVVWNFRQAFNPSVGQNVDWNNISITFRTTPPPGPPPAFSGNFTGTPNVLGLGIPTAGTTIWNEGSPQPGLTDGSGELATGTRYTGFGWDLVGNEVGYRIDHAGGPLDLTLTGLSSDLDMALLDSSGIPVNTVAVSQGFGGTTSESISIANAAAGTYYAVVDTFGAANLGSTYEITYIPTPGALALLGLGGLMAARRRRA